MTSVTRENGDVIAYQYDGVGRLMDEWRRTSGAAMVYRNRFQYDAVGNRTQWIATDSVAASTTFNYTYNTLNQLTQRYWTKASVNYTEDYTYDLNGNLTQKDEKTGGALQLRWLYEWDDEDRLVSVVKKNGAGTVILTVEYAYCPACGGNRTQKRVWNGTKTDQNLVKWLQYETEGLNQLRVDEKWESQSDENNYLDALDPWRTVRVSYNGPGQISQLLKEDVYTYESQTTSTPSNVTSIYYNYDRMGVVAGLSNVAGSELEQFESDAFGSWDGQNTYTTRRITGKEYDEDVGLYRFKARLYDPKASVFVSRSTLLPHQEHPYLFASADPIGLVDPAGEMTVLVGGGIGAGIGALGCGILSGFGELPPEIVGWQSYACYVACMDALCAAAGFATGAAGTFGGNIGGSIGGQRGEIAGKIVCGGITTGTIMVVAGPIQNTCVNLCESEIGKPKYFTPQDCWDRCKQLEGHIDAWRKCFSYCKSTNPDGKWKEEAQKQCTR